MTDWGAHHFGGATFAVDVRELQPNKVVLDEIDGKKLSVSSTLMALRLLTTNQALARCMSVETTFSVKAKSS